MAPSFVHLAAVEAAFGREIEHLPADHAAKPRAACERQDERDAHGRIGMRLRPRQNVEREREQSVAGKDRGRLVELLVRGRAPAAQVVIVHRGQIVVRQRIAVHELERGAGHQRALARRLEQRGGLDHQERAQPLSAGEAHVAHRVHQPLRARALLGKRRIVEQALEHALDIGGDTIEALPERRSGVGHIIHVWSSVSGPKISSLRVPSQAVIGPAWLMARSPIASAKEGRNPLFPTGFCVAGQAAPPRLRCSR